MSIFDGAETVVVGPSWRCPHCRTLQPAATRCRACARATISCSTCARYRTSVATDLGYCADDAGRTPLLGEEVRTCWTDQNAGPRPGPADPLGLFPEIAPTPPARALGASAPGTGVPTSASPLDGDASAGLVEAPYVAPTGRLTSELARRTRRDAG